MGKYIFAGAVAMVFVAWIVGVIGERATRQLRSDIDTETRATQDAARKDVVIIEDAGAKAVKDLFREAEFTDSEVNRTGLEITASSEKDSPCSVSPEIVRLLNLLPR